jgi:D-glycero-alpha-D-manno-heptose-7-phosphate kinase
MLQIKKNAYQIRDAIMEGNLERFGYLLREAWEAKKKMSPGISNDFLDGIYDLSSKHGAVGGKLTGAGGGGYFMFYCQNGKQSRLKEVLEQEGLKLLDFHFEDKGVTSLNTTEEE